jgi:hypothetical protein
MEKIHLFIFRPQTVSGVASPHETNPRRSDERSFHPPIRSSDQGHHLSDLSAQDRPSRVPHPGRRLGPDRLHHRLLRSSGFVRTPRGSINLTCFVLLKLFYSGFDKQPSLLEIYFLDFWIDSTPTVIFRPDELELR